MGANILGCRHALHAYLQSAGRTWLSQGIFSLAALGQSKEQPLTDVQIREEIKHLHLKVANLSHLEGGLDRTPAENY
ncbi:MAG: hypothetical protein A2782_01750 [Candidatus Blackburnbacteria bacterium RIFCSPHIGHO2_01_FULL_43_15b]|uniref:Uncharacterized protein n=1 Tax=Candidatus Blackburnbacteria bacterium RIFCSPHIGHO2_01_FULL_43_15b TaxID=1797513 RepID=A0A1G1UXK0_9BACT|nr:MAG: hypothetical protein A2782_01750 [Candidatus Blackburnbacteria bacterium RIFCSPHIGHO2_01_FULL_43_15b]